MSRCDVFFVIGRRYFEKYPENSIKIKVLPSVDLKLRYFVCKNCSYCYVKVFLRQNPVFIDDKKYKSLKFEICAELCAHCAKLRNYLQYGKKDR